MQGRIWIAIALAVVLAGGAGYYLWQRSQATAPADAQPETSVPPLPREAAEPPIRHPLPQQLAEPESAPPLPPLAESDPAAREALAGLIGEQAVLRFVVPDSLVRRAVATVDGLARRRLAVQVRPVAATPGSFRTTDEGEQTTLDPANYERYVPFVRIVQGVDAQQAAALYGRFYPLLQQSYAELGYPRAYFNDRLIEVIDHLLATPEVQGPIALQRSRLIHEFADPALESRSAGQKLLIRMGPDNARIIKEKLRELRAALAAGEPPASP